MEKILATQSRDIPLSAIVPGTNYSRSVYDVTAQESLKKSIIETGLLQPVGVSPSADDPKKYDLVYGYRRYRAHLDLGKAEIPATIVSTIPLSEMVRMKMNVIENNERKAVTLIESGLRWRRLIENGQFTSKEIAHFEGVAEKKVLEAVDIYKRIPTKYLTLVVPNDPRVDQSNLITQSKAHSIMTATKYDGMLKYTSELFELVRQHNANEKEITECRKLIQTDYSPVDALNHVRKLKSRVFAKTLNFRVKKTKWLAFRDEHGHNISDIVATAIKKKDMAILEQVAGFLS